MSLTVRRVLLALAILCAVVFTVCGFDGADGLVDFDHPFGWLGLAVALGLANRWA